MFIVNGINIPETEYKTFSVTKKGYNFDDVLEKTLSSLEKQINHSSNNEIENYKKYNLYPVGGISVNTLIIDREFYITASQSFLIKEIEEI